MALEAPLVEERDTLTEQIGQGFEEGGLGGAVTGGLRGLGQMFLPQAGLPGQRDLGSVLSSFVEFSRLGDVGDIGAALDPNSGLDPLERLLAASPLIGAGAIGTRATYKRLNARHQQAIGYSMNPGPGQAYDLNTTWEDQGGLSPNPEQRRQQEALLEQRALEIQSPLARPVLRAETWEDLSASLLGTGYQTGGNRVNMEGALRGIGSAVLAISPNPALYGDGPSAQFVAAKVAVAKWNRAVELGVVDPLGGKDLDVHTQMVLDLVGSVDRTDNIVRIAQLEAATASFTGPDLVLPSPGRLARVKFTETGEPQVFVATIDELLPTERVFDEEAMLPLDDGLVRSRQQAVDYEAMSGVSGVNIAKAFVEVSDSITDPESWYRNFNRTARALAETTGYSVHQTAGVIAAISANQPWIPNNLIGATHVILQTGRPDLIPGSPEYIAEFRKATIEAGWQWDMFDETGAGVREQFGPSEATGFQPDFEGVMQHYADPANVTGENGFMMGVDETKADKIDLILKGNLPPWLVLRMMKTNTFGRLGAEPTLLDLVVTDTWSDRVFWGTLFTGTPLPFDGRTKGLIKADATYYDPVSGESMSGAEILPRIDAMAEQHGWTPDQVDRWKRLLAEFPSKTAQARFAAQARAHLVVRDEFGFEAGHAVQAPSWVRARDKWDGLMRRISEAKTEEELRVLVAEAHLTTTAFTHLEGNPLMEKTAAGMLWEVNDTLSGPSVTEADLEAARKGAQREASSRVNSSIIAVATPDGKVTPYANLDTPGVVETLRHATPSGVRVGGFERMIANRARKVQSAQDHVAEISRYDRADGRKAAGFVTTVFDPESPGHPGMLPGDRAVVILPQDRVKALEAELNSSWPFDYRIVNANTEATATSRNPILASDLEGLTPDQLGHVLMNNDWVAISAFRSDATDGANWDAQRRLRQDIEKKGGTLVEMEGVYGGDPEPSFLVTGLSYADAAALGKKYGQESIATRHALIYTTGENAGTYHPVQDKVRFGEDVDADGHSRLSTGQKFSFDYDWSEAHPLPGDLDTLADAGSRAEPMAQVTIEMGGEYGSHNWQVVERTLKRVGSIPGARVRLYSHSPNKIPSNFSKATESVFTDDSGVTASVLHRNGDQYARHHADVWVPDWELLTLSEDGFGPERMRRSPLDARAVMDVDQELGVIRFDGDLQIVVPPDSDVTMGSQGSVFRSLKVDGRLVRELVVDTSGPIPSLVVGVENALPAPGRTVVQLSNGKVTKILPHRESDWADARDALASAGLVPDDESVKVEYPAGDQEASFEETVVFSRRELETRRANALKYSVATIPADVDATKTIKEMIPFFPKVRLGRNAHPDLHRQVVEVLEALHGEGSERLPGVKMFQDEGVFIPTKIWRGSYGIDTVHVMDKPDLDAATHQSPDLKGIVFNERQMVTRWNLAAPHPGSADWFYRSESLTDFEATLVHEIGHLISVDTPATRVSQYVTEVMDVMGEAGVRVHLGRYALENNNEFVAEAFHNVMVEGGNAHPALVDLVRKVIKNAST